MSDDEAQRKAAKKAAKRARREAEEAAAIAAEAPEPDAVEAVEEEAEEDEEARRARKAAKKAAKKAKRDAEEAAAAAAAAAAAEAAVAEQPTKKKHKAQSARSDSAHAMGNYVPHSAMSSMTMEEADAFRANAGITLTPPEAAERYHPITQFEHLRPSLGDLCPDIMHYVEAKKFKTPTFIQVNLIHNILLVLIHILSIRANFTVSSSYISHYMTYDSPNAGRCCWRARI
jgi:hypothetical protein